MVRILGWVKIQVQPPKTTLKHIAISKYRETYEST